LVISRLCKHLKRKQWGFSKSPIHAEFEKVLNFVPSA
jgi:hypothetical protein